MSNPNEDPLKNYNILAGHTKRGSTFSRFPNKLSETNYAEDTLPELLWIALLNEALGLPVTVSVITAIGQSIPANDDQVWFTFSTPLANLPEAISSMARDQLIKEDLFQKIQQALEPFVYLFPSFPISWFEIEPRHNPDYLPQFKRLLSELLDKTSGPSTLMLAIALHGLTVSETLVLPTSSIVNLNDVVDYPRTDKSRLVASAVRALMSTVIRFAVPEPSDDGWSQQFWQRGLELEPVDYKNLLSGMNV